MLQIKNLNMAAAITAATGQDAVLDEHGDGWAGFLFPDTPEVTGAAARYATGELMLPAKVLLRVRGDLYRQLKQLRGKR